MNRTLPSIIAGLVIFLVLALYMVVYQVRDDQVALVRTFGRIAAPQPKELFKVPSAVRSELDEGRIPAAVNAALAKQQIALTDRATCVPLVLDKFREVQLPKSMEAGWRITDGSQRLLLTLSAGSNEIVAGDMNDMVSDDVNTEAGPYLKWPWPIQRVEVLDNRIHMTPMPGEEAATKDAKNIIVTTMVGWRIAEPYLYSNTNGSLDDAAGNLKTLIRDKQKTVIGQYDFGDFISTDPAVLRYEQIEDEIRAQIQEEARADYGIEIRFLGFKRLALPEQITEKVFSAMKEERNTEAARYTAAGASEAARIKSEAESIAGTIIDFAHRKAADIVAEGKQRAAEYNKTFGQNQDLAIFLLKMEYLGQILKDRTTIILDHEPPFDLLMEGAATGGTTKVPDTVGDALPETTNPK